MNVIIYTRVSTKEQVEGYSLTYQEKFCREYAEKQQWKVLEVFEEQGESAKTADRTQLQNLLNYCQKNKGKVDILLVHKLDRFARNTADHQAVRAILVRFGVKIRSVTEQIDDNPAGKLMENIFSAVAQFDNDVRSERTKAGMLEKLRHGYWPWKAPYGYLNSSAGLVIEETSSGIIKGAFETYAKGGYTITAIVSKLNKLTYNDKKNNKFTPQRLSKIFNNKLYMGVVSAWGEEHDGVHESVISKEIFYTVNSIRLGKSNQALIPHSTNNPKFPLKNIVNCYKCGKNLTASSSTNGKKEKKYAYYHCTCGAVRVDKDTLNNRFYEYLKQIQPNEDFRRVFRMLLIDVWERKHKEEASAIERVDAEIFRLKELRKRLLQKNLEGVVGDSEYVEQRELFNMQLATREVERAELRNDESNMDHMISLAESLFSNVASVWLEASFINKQRFQSLIFPSGLPVSNESFGTQVLGLPFNLIVNFEGDETTLVTRGGIEPPLSE